MLWARPAVTVLGIDCPPVVGLGHRGPGQARARVSLRVPPGIGRARTPRRRCGAHLEAAAPWGAEVEVEPRARADPFVGSTAGPAYAALSTRPSRRPTAATTDPRAGRLDPPLQRAPETYPEAEIMLIGVEEPSCLIHAANESVDPSEIERIALAEALFLQRLGSAGGRT